MEFSCTSSGVSCTLLHYTSNSSSTQVAQIYQSIEFTRLASLVPFVDAFQLERSIVDAARHCDLQVYSTRGLVTTDNLTNTNVCLKFFSYLGPYRSHFSNSELWIWSELLHQRGFPSWPFPTENALGADQEPAHCHVCITGQSYPGHQACLHPGEWPVCVVSLLFLTHDTLIIVQVSHE